GGAVLMLCGLAAVSPDGRAGAHDLDLGGDAAVDELRRLVEACAGTGARTGVILGHAGRRARGPGRIAASALAFGDGSPPRAAAAGDPERLVTAYAAATRRVLVAGLDTVVLDAAGGGLLASFLSPVTNQRTDEHGGGPEGRARL